MQRVGLVFILLDQSLGGVELPERKTMPRA
jgi:hypothetical protein